MSNLAGRILRILVKIDYFFKNWRWCGGGVGGFVMIFAELVIGFLI